MHKDPLLSGIGFVQQGAWINSYGALVLWIILEKDMDAFSAYISGFFNGGASDMGF